MDFPAVYADNPTGFGTAFKNRAGMRKAMQMYLKFPLFHVLLYLFSHRPDTSRANNRPISRKEWLHLQPVHMKTTVFPLPFQSHLIFCVIATIFFVIQFIRLRRAYQLIFAVAVPATLLLYINDSQTWFYGIGIFELVMLLLAVVTVCIDHLRAKQKAPADKPDEASKA